MSTTIPKISKDFGDNLKRWRGRRTQEEAARELKIGKQQQYGRYEKGEMPQTKTVVQIAKLIGVDPAKLYQENGICADTVEILWPDNNTREAVLERAAKLGIGLNQYLVKCATSSLQDRKFPKSVAHDIADEELGRERGRLK